MAASLLGGAAVGAVFGELLKAVLEIKNKATMFKQTLNDLRSTLLAVYPVVKEIEHRNNDLGRPKEELESLIRKMEEGIKLVYQCSKIGRYNYAARVRYQEQLMALADSLLKFFIIDMQAQTARDQKETLFTVKRILSAVNKIPLVNRQDTMASDSDSDDVSESETHYSSATETFSVEEVMEYVDQVYGSETGSTAIQQAQDAAGAYSAWKKLREAGHIGMGKYLSTPKTKKFSEDGETDRLGYGLSSMQGWCSTMEDAHAAYIDLDESTSFFGVYDGHGGKVVAKFCAKFLHQQVLKSEAYAAGDIGTSLQKAFSRMDEMMCGQRGWRELATLGNKINKFTVMIEGLIWSPRSSDGNDQVGDWVCEKGPHSDFAGPTSGSTACVAVIRNNQLFVANAGDSRCVISRKGQAYNLSRDHKPDLEIEKERILKAGGFIHAGRVNGSLNLARAIGDMEFKQNKFLPAEKQIVTANPDINTVELCDEDEFMVLACDGIWDCMSSQQLVDFVHEQLHSETKLSAVCERVLDRCLAPSTVGGEGCDNMTMILVQFKKPAQSSALAEEQSFSNGRAESEPKQERRES